MKKIICLDCGGNHKYTVCPNVKKCIHGSKTPESCQNCINIASKIANNDLVKSKTLRIYSLMLTEIEYFQRRMSNFKKRLKKEMVSF